MNELQYPFPLTHATAEALTFASGAPHPRTSMPFLTQKTRFREKKNQSATRCMNNPMAYCSVYNENVTRIAKQDLTVFRLISGLRSPVIKKISKPKNKRYPFTVARVSLFSTSVFGDRASGTSARLGAQLIGYYHSKHRKRDPSYLKKRPACCGSGVGTRDLLSCWHSQLGMLLGAQQQ